MTVSEVLRALGSAPLPDKDPRSHEPDSCNHHQGLRTAIDIPQSAVRPEEPGVLGQRAVLPHPENGHRPLFYGLRNSAIR